MNTDSRLGALRIAFVTQTYHPVVGGMEGQLKRLLPGLQARGVEPLVVTRGLPGMAGEEQVAGVRVIRCGSVRYGAMGSLAFLVMALWTLYREKPDLVHAFSLMTPSTIAGWHRICGGSPFIVKVLRGGPKGDLDRIRHKPLFGLRRRMLRLTIDAAQVISDEIDAELASVGIAADRRHRISNGVDVEALDPGPNGRRLRTALGIESNAPVFIYVGRLVAEKRIDLLLGAFAGVRACNPGARLLIAGDGPERNRVLAAATTGSGIIALGQTDDVTAVFASATVYVLPSSTEGMSNSLLEAMATGLRIVATDVGAARELLGASERGWVVRPNDQTALENAMLASLDAPANEKGRLAKHYVNEHYSLSSTLDALVGVYRSLALPARPLVRDAGEVPR